MNEHSHVQSKFFLLSRVIAFDFVLVVVGLYIGFVDDVGLSGVIGIGKHAIWIIGIWNIYRRIKTYQAIGKEGKAWWRSETIRDNLVFAVLGILNLWFALKNGKQVVVPLISIWSAVINIYLRVAFTKTRITHPFTGE